MNKYNAKLAALLLIFSFGIASCFSTGVPEEDWVVAPLDLVKEEVVLEPGPKQEGAALNLEILEDRNQLPDLVLTQIHNAQLPSEVAIVQRKHLKEGADTTKVINLSFGVTFVDEEGNTQVDTAGTIQSVFGIVSAAFPPAAPYVALASLVTGTLFKQRSRKHVIKSVKKITPYDGKIDIAGAIKDFSRAMGWDHTSDTPEDLRRRADLLEAESKAKAKSKALQEKEAAA